jgi:tetratricopeptide (TPR) repeat protein
VELDPGHANGKVALGIAALRDNDLDGAKGPLEKAVVLAPRNPFALRALGQLLLKKDNVPAALPHLRAAATVAPDDPINPFTYAQCLLAIEGESHETEAGELFKRALRLAPVGELAEKIKSQQRRLAGLVMRSNAQGLPRMDAVMYLSSALEAYRALDLVGQKHHLRQYQGGVTVSALPCRSPASSMWVCSCCCRGRTPGSTSLVSTSSRKEWREWILLADPLAWTIVAKAARAGRARGTKSLRTP